MIGLGLMLRDWQPADIGAVQVLPWKPIQQPISSMTKPHLFSVHIPSSLSKSPSSLKLLGRDTSWKVSCLRRTPSSRPLLA